MHTRTAIHSNEYEVLCTWIARLRAQLEDAALSSSAEETLALSQQLDVLLNRLMLSRSRNLRCSYPLSISNRPICCAAHAPKRRPAPILPFHRRNA